MGIRPRLRVLSGSGAAAASASSGNTSRPHGRAVLGRRAYAAPGSSLLSGRRRSRLKLRTPLAALRGSWVAPRPRAVGRLNPCGLALGRPRPQLKILHCLPAPRCALGRRVARRGSGGVMPQCGPSPRLAAHKPSRLASWRLCLDATFVAYVLTDPS